MFLDKDSETIESCILKNNCQNLVSESFAKTGINKLNLSLYIKITNTVQIIRNTLLLNSLLRLKSLIDFDISNFWSRILDPSILIKHFEKCQVRFITSTPL